MVPISSDHSVQYRRQNTLKDTAIFSGIGIHTGQVVSVRFVPAEEGTGIVFKRVDLPGNPLIPARLEYVCDTSRSTTIGVADVRIHTVEHLLAALRVYQVDNLIVEIDSIEPPVGNGSSDVFVEMIESVGVEKQTAKAPIVKVSKPVFWTSEDIHIVALPYDGYKISYTLNYPDSDVLKAQYFTSEITAKSFKEQIASCRTFSQYKEVSFLMDKGLIKGGSLDNAVIIHEGAIFSKNGLFFSNEMARHKVLDMIGDLSLVGLDFHAHIISVRSGHMSNFAFAQELYKTITSERVNV